MRAIDKNYKKNEFPPMLLDKLRPYLTPKTKKEKLLMGGRIQRMLFGRNEFYKSDEEEKFNLPSEREKFLSMVFFNYSETNISLENLNMISVFVNQYPKYKSFEKYNITRTKYLRYHIENYLNEVYLFQERINAFLQRLIRICQKKNLNKDIEKLRRMQNLINTGLADINKIRGSHMHNSRYTDKDLDQLDGLELYSTSFNNLAVMRTLTYRRIRIKWSKIINNSNENIDKFFHTILEGIKPIVFNTLLPFYEATKN